MKKDLTKEFIINSFLIDGVSVDESTYDQAHEHYLESLIVGQVLVPSFLHGYFAAIEFMKSQAEGPTIDHLLYLHHLVTNKAQGGEFRTAHHNLKIRLNVAAKDVPYKMEQWCLLWDIKHPKALTNKKAALTRLCEFEWIRPFVDSNGALARMLYFWDCSQKKIKPQMFLPEEYKQTLEEYDQSYRDKYLSKWLSTP